MEDLAKICSFHFDKDKNCICVSRKNYLLLKKKSVEITNTVITITDSGMKYKDYNVTIVDND